MGEVVQFPRQNQSSEAALGRFLIGSAQESLVNNLKMVATANRPTTAQIVAAKKELQFIFGGDNTEVAEELYRQGLEDVVHRKRAISKSTANHDGSVASATVEASALLYSDAARFYMHVEQLTATAAAEYDCVHTTTVNQARFNRVHSLVTG